MTKKISSDEPKLIQKWIHLGATIYRHIIEEDHLNNATIKHAYCYYKDIEHIRWIQIIDNEIYRLWIEEVGKGDIQTLSQYNNDTKTTTAYLFGLNMEFNSLLAENKDIIALLAKMPIREIASDCLEYDLNQITDNNDIEGSLRKIFEDHKRLPHLVMNYFACTLDHAERIKTQKSFHKAFQLSEEILDEDYSFPDRLRVCIVIRSFWDQMHTCKTIPQLYDFINKRINGNLIMQSDGLGRYLKRKLGLSLKGRGAPKKEDR